jgi:ribosomal protein S6E (S10)
MTILIAPVGENPDHVKSWLVEVGHNATKLHLIHSKKGKVDYPQKAKQCQKDIEKTFQRIEIKRTVIDDALSIEPTFDVITKIIDEERKADEADGYKQNLVNGDFILNITGGTNAMGAATMLAATFLQTRAQYVLQKMPGDPKGLQYVRELPIKSVNMAKTNENQLEILKIIAEHEFKIENTPSNLDVSPTIGKITRQELMKIFNENAVKKAKKQKKKFKKLTPSSLSGITDKLQAAKLIESEPYVEYYVLPNNTKYNENSCSLDLTSKPPQVIYGEKRRHLGQENTIPRFAKWPLPLVKDKNGVTYTITGIGKTQSRYSYLFDDAYNVKKS